MEIYILSFMAGAAVASAFLTLHHSNQALKDAQRRLHEAQENLRVFQDNREKARKEQP